jgi:hydroxymethylglutaryl-CoA reductase (NADPH)
MVTNSGSSKKEDELVDKLLSGDMKFYDLEEKLRDYSKAARIRLLALKKKFGLEFQHVGSYSISPENCRPNIENMFGAIQIPLGFAGPVKINGEYTKGNFFLPMATTEGSLVASVNRGCSAINTSNGANVHVFSNSQTRSLLFRTDSLSDATTLVTWTKDNFDKIKELAEKNSRYLRLEGAEPFIVGNIVWLRLSAFTGDAMGMNMITIAADTIGKYINDNLNGVKFISASGNMCVDKKPSALNMILGRGKKVVAEARIKKELFEKYFKASAENIVELNYLKNYMGSALAGSYGFNAHFANIIAALFIATGQDHAHVVEGSMGFTHVESVNDEILLSVTLPSLEIGTIGGGTRVETQKECLQMLGVAGSGDPPGMNSLKLAEIFGVGVLAGEVSLLGALAAHDLAKAHMRYNR